MLNLYSNKQIPAFESFLIVIYMIFVCKNRVITVIKSGAIDMADEEHFLPLILAGPIVRRVDANLCSIWLATSDAADVTLKLYNGITNVDGAGTPTTAPYATSSKTTLRQFGKNLFIGIVQIEFKPPSGGPSSTGPFLTPGQLYSYDIEIVSGTKTTNLSTAGLLKDVGSGNTILQLALGYETGRLPSFIAPPATVDKVRLAHASCRKSHGIGPDAMAWLDDVINFEYTRENRPQQLFLTGDQIYADDVPACLLPMLNYLGILLLGYEEFVIFENGNQTNIVRGNLENLPTLRRRKLIREAAKMSSTACDNHLITFGEFAAMYLFSWSPSVWRSLYDNTTWRPLPRADDILVAISSTLNPNHKAMLTDWESCNSTTNPWKDIKGDAFQKECERVIAWRNSVPKVARALANISTYMIWDDHEITDDWNLNKRWRNRVLTTSLGKEIIRNGSLAYGLFQGWGNDPQAFTKEESTNKDFIDKASTLLNQDPQTLSTTPDTSETGILSSLNVLCGLIDGNDDKQVVWHYQVPGPRHSIVVMDSRTRRTFVGAGIAPAKLLGDKPEEQIPAKSAPDDGRELLILVSPAPVLGPHILEQFGASIYEMVADTRYGFEHLQKRADNPCKPGGTATGVEEADAEGWGANEPAREELLKLLATHGKVVILSGDVHYACSLVLDFWTYNNPSEPPEPPVPPVPPARIIQLTSSACRNGFSELVEAILRRNALLQRYQPGISPERLAWKNKAPPINIPKGAQISPGRRSRMQRAPALLNAQGWPKGTYITQGKLPDWCWRLTLIRDIRKESELAQDVQRPPLTMELDENDPIAFYGAIAARHQLILKKSFQQLRQMVFTTNIGLVSITKNSTDNSLQVTHKLLSQNNQINNGYPSQPNTVHTVKLTPAGDAPVLKTEDK